MFRVFRIALVLTFGLASFSMMRAQSFTTGTLNLRNSSAQSVSLSTPSTGVTPYSILLPASAGGVGQVLTIDAVAGSTATLRWSEANYWGLEGSAITTGGTAAGQQYLGTSNAQDVVLASNGAERIRILGVPGPGLGRIGIGTATPSSFVDIAGDLRLSSSGPASLLSFAEPSADGTNTTSFRAQAQSADVVYTLPAAAPAADGMVLTATPAGLMQWSSPQSFMGRGSYTPASTGYVHIIPTTGYDLQPGDVALVSVQGPAGSTIAFTITAINDVANTITVETSTDLTTADRITWAVIPQ
jgi:hypothetical protein